MPSAGVLHAQPEVAACARKQVGTSSVPGQLAPDGTLLLPSFAQSQLVREPLSTAHVRHEPADMPRPGVGSLRVCSEVSDQAHRVEVLQDHQYSALGENFLEQPSAAQSQLVRASLSTAPVHDGPAAPRSAPAWLWEPPFTCVCRDVPLPPLPQVRPGDDDREARTPPPRPRISEPGRPGNVAMIRAMHVHVFPESARATPIFDGQLGAYSWSGRNSAKPGFITVFDRVRHHVQMRVPAQASLHEAVALAVSSAPFSVGAIQILTVPVPGLPCPQLVLQ